MARQGRWVEVESWGWRGRVWQAKDATRTFYIRRQVNGHLYDVSTRCTTLAAALKQYERFEADPAGYDPANAGAHPDAIYLDEKLAGRFLAWSRDVKQNSGPWVAKQRGVLAWWGDKLHRADLRDGRGSLLKDRILPALEGNPPAMRNVRIRVLKALYGWLRKVEHAVAAAEDPTYGALSAAQAQPAQVKRSRVVPREHFVRVRDALAQPWRDALVLQGGTGMHVTEIARFARGGTVEPLPAGMKVEHGAVGVVVIPLHKSGAPHRVAVSREVLDAATRLRGRQGFSVEWYARAVRAACKAAGVRIFGPGSLRHSVATWAINAGADVASVATFLGHRSATTTRRFYITHATATKVPTLA